jgi:hypothetical protein
MPVSWFRDLSRGSVPHCTIPAKATPPLNREADLCALCATPWESGSIMTKRNNRPVRLKWPAITARAAEIVLTYTTTTFDAATRPQQPGEPPLFVPATPRVRIRKPISRDVRLFVWQRDGGRCVYCRSQERLE